VALKLYRVSARSESAVRPSLAMHNTRAGADQLVAAPRTIIADGG
jgi:hypothetical protein